MLKLTVTLHLSYVKEKRKLKLQMTIYCNLPEDTGPPAEVKMCGSKSTRRTTQIA